MTEKKKSEAETTQNKTFELAQPAQPSLSERLSLLQKQLAVAALILAVLYFACQVASFFADILRILGISVLLSYLFINVVDWLESPLRSRAAAIFVVYIVCIVVTAIGIVLVVPAMVYQVSQLLESTFQQLPQLIEMLTSALAPLEAKLHAAQIQVRAIDILTSVAQNIPRPDPSIMLGRMADVATTTMTWSLYALSILVVSFYFLLDGYRMKAAVIKLFPPKYHEELTCVTGEIDHSMQAFFRGQLVLGLVFGAIMVGVYSVMGIHYALLCGAILGVWEIVPVIGPPIGFLPTMIAVAVSGMDNVGVNRVGQVVLVFLVFNSMQWLKDNLVAPRYIGNVIGLHPVMIFIAIMIGARLDGMLGIIFALPAACAANVIVAHLTRSKNHGNARDFEPTQGLADTGETGSQKADDLVGSQAILTAGAPEEL